MLLLSLPEGTDPAIPVLCIYPKKTKTLIQNIYIHSNVHCNFIIDKIWKQPKCPLLDEWINSDIKKNEILSSVATCMDLEGIMLSEISQTEKDKYYMWNLKNKESKQT